MSEVTIPRDRRRSVDASLVLASRVLGLGLSFVAGVVTARVFSPDVRGEYALLATVAAFASVAVNFGFAEAIIFFHRRSEADRARTPAWALLVTALVAASVCLVGWLAAPTMAGRWFPTGGTWVAWCALAAALLSVLQRNGIAFLQAEGDFVWSSALSVLQSATFVLGLLALVGGDADFQVAAGIFAASWALAALPALLPLVRDARFRTLSRASLAEVFRFSFKSYANVAVNQLSYRVDIFVLAWLGADLAGVADYHIASMLVGFAWIIPDAYATAIYPRLAGLTSERERARETVAALRIVLVPSLAATAGLAAICEILIPALFGEEYAGATAMTLLLLPGVLAMCVNKVLSRYFLSRNRHQITAWSMAAGVAVDLLLLLWLVPTLGGVGAAIAASAAYFVTTGLTLSAFLRMGECKVEDLRGFPGREIAAYRRFAAEFVGRVFDRIPR